MSDIFLNFFTVLNSLCTGYISSSVAAVARAIAPAAYTLLGVYILVLGFMYLRGMIKEPIMDTVIRLIKICFIFGVALQLASYNEYVVDTFFNAPIELGNALTGATSQDSIIQSLGTMLANTYDLGNVFWERAGILAGNFGGYLIAIFIWVMGFAITGYAAFLIALAKIALSIIISLGPLFIMTLLFDVTKRFFESWIGQLANYFFVIVLVVAANVFTLNIFAGAVNNTVATGTSIEIAQLLPFFISGILCLLILGQVREIAAGLAGGISLSTFGLGRMTLAIINRPIKRLAAATGRKGMEYGNRGVKYTSRKAIQYYKANRNKVYPS